METLAPPLASVAADHAWRGRVEEFVSSAALGPSAQAQLAELLDVVLRTAGGRPAAAAGVPAGKAVTVSSLDLATAFAVIPNVRCFTPVGRTHVHVCPGGVVITKDGTAATHLATIPRDAVSGVFKLTVPVRRGTPAR
jgi:hypothetical protein